MGCRFALFASAKQRDDRLEVRELRNRGTLRWIFVRRGRIRDALVQAAGAGEIASSERGIGGIQHFDAAAANGRSRAYCRRAPTCRRLGGGSDRRWTSRG